jgi:xanthine dehydrogenase YagS FAD-binding subunit
MKAFEWTNPTTVNEAVKMLTVASPGDVDEAPRPLAGGQDLLTTMKDYTSRPTRLVNLKNIRGLNKITLNARGLTIGALVTLTELEEHAGVRKSFPGLAEAAHSIATPQIRNLGTVGGNLCQRPRCWYFRLEEVICLKKGGSECYAASGENKYNAIIAGGPSYIVHPSDLAPMLLALGATVTVMGAAGKRVIPLDKFFTLPSEGNIRRENVLKNEEIITEIHVPASPLAARSTYLKFKERESLDFALASAAVAVRLTGRIVLGGVAPIPWRGPAAEKFLVGKELKPDVLAEAAKIALAEAQPLEKNAYKVPLAQTLVRRALAKAGGV